MRQQLKRQPNSAGLQPRQQRMMPSHEGLLRLLRELRHQSLPGQVWGHDPPRQARGQSSLAPWPAVQVQGWLHKPAGSGLAQVPSHNSSRVLHQQLG